ncbi:MAG: hypothetical protein QXI16_00765 [Sulfolobaceae archaeon]
MSNGSNTMNNVILVINILQDIYSIGSEILLMIKKAQETNTDITDEELQSIISQRDDILQDLKNIAGV